jgi:predicted permease
MTGLFSDLRLAARRLARAPGFTLAAVATLTIGIGAVAGVGAILYGLMWRPLPAVTATGVQVVVPVIASQRYDPEDAAISWRELEALRASDGFAAVGGVIERSLTLTGAGEPQRVLGASVTPGYFELLGVAPLVGRTFRAEEAESFGLEPVAMVAHELWLTRYGGDPGLVGRAIEINQRQLEVVGVLPPGFGMPGRIQVYVPFAPGDQVDRAAPMLWPVARPTGGDRARAAAQLDAAFAALERERPPGAEPRTARLVPLRRALGPEDNHLAILLGGVVATVLLLCCANVANLQIARAAGRQSELAVRAALGAGRGRLVRQTLAESTLLAAAGGALGALYGRAWLDFSLATLADDRPAWLSFDYDARLAVGGGAIAVLSAVACGLWPALRTSDARLLPGLSGAGRGGDRGAARRTQRLLVVGQFAFALALVAAGSWMTRSVLAVTRTDVGFEPRGLLTMRFYLPGDRWDEVEARARFQRELVARIAALPGVRGAALTGAIPADDGGADVRVADPRAAPGAAGTLPATAVPIQPELFATLGVDFLEGGPFAAGEGKRADSAAVVINRALAEALWPGERALGRSLRYGAASDAPRLTVAGVVPDLVYEEITEQTLGTRHQLYLPYARMPWRTSALLVRTEAEPAALAAAVRSALAALEPDAPVYDVRTMPARLAMTWEDQRLIAQLLGLFAAQGLLLAAVGVFGVLAYAVAQRRRELGIRAALGARPGRIAREIAGEGLRLAAWGTLAGLVLALAGGRALRGVVYGIDPLEPAPLVLVVLLLAAVAAAACAGPARRAARLDPATVLREE